MKLNKLMPYARWIFSLIVWLAIFASFVSGQFTDTIIFSWFPLIIHQIIGWIGIIATIFSAASEIMS